MSAGSPAPPSASPAMALGLVAAILLGLGIVLLIHHDKRDR
jgi:uncharacterized protein involved in exopolysaccharide biosynthesis